MKKKKEREEKKHETSPVRHLQLGGSYETAFSFLKRIVGQAFPPAASMGGNQEWLPYNC